MISGQDTPRPSVSQDTPVNELILNHLGKVDIAARMLCQKLPPQFEWRELAQVGVLAMVEAAPRYLPEKGSFWTFVYSRVRGAMIDFVSSGTVPRGTSESVVSCRTGVPAPRAPISVTAPVDAARCIGKLTCRERQVCDGIGQGNTARQVAAALGISEPRVSQIRRRARERLSVA